MRTGRSVLPDQELYLPSPETSGSWCGASQDRRGRRRQISVGRVEGPRALLEGQEDRPLTSLRNPMALPVSGVCRVLSLTSLAICLPFLPRI